MTHQIDESFRLKKQARAASRRRARLKRAFYALAALALIAAVAAYATFRWQPAFDDDDQELQFADNAQDLPPEAPVFVPAIVDLAGDPMWITLSQDAEGRKQVLTVDRPAEVDDPNIPERIQLLSDTMVSSSERFMTTIPSSQEDFAFFQAQRAADVIAPMAAPGDFQSTPQAPGDASANQPSSGVDDTAAGWGETVGSKDAELPAFKKTAIENNTTVAMEVPEEDRFDATEDFFVKVLATRSLESVALQTHFSAADAKLADEAMQALFNTGALEPGFVVALRGARATRDAALTLMQVSIYANNLFIGTAARNDAGVFVSGADPWVKDDLFNYSGIRGQDTVNRQYRLLDAIYSTAARNNVPTTVIGEAIMYLSRGQDLNAFAAPSDRLLLAYSDRARGSDGASGRVLFVGIKSADKSIDCFVYQQADGEYACVTGDDQVQSLTVTNGMVTPVNGVMTSTFGPRMHPILHVVRVHKGVDWAAPVGTPVFAAYDGRIVFEGDGGEYGNLVRIAHDGGRETRYAHLQRFAEKTAVDSMVKAGDVIGYVGTSGLSTGPHLHFELYQGSDAIDPLGTVTVADSDDSSVETLTDQIVHVESGGSARAKNPNSSATGLGQFITSTWIRMMNTYRPDLARSLSREDLLALRFDPTISREMVRNLAREGEAYLKARGHQITAGRLYLCHFLGADGAHRVLSAPGSTALIDVLGPDVINANRFLTGKSAAYVVDWAERKMHGRRGGGYSSGVVVREVRQTSPEFLRYKAAVELILASAPATL